MSKASTPRIVVESNGNPLLSAQGEVVFGARTGCDVVLDDPVAAARHCRVAFEDGFRVRDLDSVSGTWVDGKPARPSLVISDGSEIVIGVSKLVASVQSRDGVNTLVLDLQRNVFWWKRPGKGVFDNDPDAMVRAEVGFARFRALEVGNRVAIVAALVLLVAGAFVATVMEPLADPGPLLPSHALVTEVAGGVEAPHAAFAAAGPLARDQGCDVCHSTFSGTPANKCMQCHKDLRDLDDPSTWRHPYLGDGKLGVVSGMDAGEALCAVCHQDHQGAEFLKPAAGRLVGRCEICHRGDGAPMDEDAKRKLKQELLDRVPPTSPPQGKHPLATYRFPHDVHLGKAIDCAVCHRPDSAARARLPGASNPDRDDFVETPFEVCASCHVPNAPATNMTAEEQTRWLSKNQWPVVWHGTDEGGVHCKKCHATTERSGRAVFGPELRTVERPAFSAQQYADERAQYVAAARRRHEPEFEAHANGNACTLCHLRGGIPQSDAVARTFWHALHLADGSLAPEAGKRAEISRNKQDGCLSCHGDLLQASSLRTADEGGYRWPGDAEAQAACRQCHRQKEGESIAMQPAGAIAPERRAMATVIPHAPHVNSVHFGNEGVLADGCFSCHEFESGGADFRMVPRTKPAAGSCVACHAGHDHIAGNSCQKCHPAEAGKSNSFLLSAMVPEGTTVFGRAVPPAPTRPWPRSGFSHFSRGHVGPDIECKTCHGNTGIESAKTIEAVPLPDDRTAVCRECHLQKQFHWR
ncbi:MAG TPA: FHA domain-containing protein [Planctomycetota bacterium]|nr:FHA domain-containing protein [Planctomycetota bacterium]